MYSALSTRATDLWAPSFLASMQHVMLRLSSGVTPMKRSAPLTLASCNKEMEPGEPHSVRISTHEATLLRRFCCSSMRVTSWPSLKRSLAKWLPICPAPAITMRMGMSGRKGACENTKRGAAEGARPRMKAAVRGCGRKRVSYGGDSAAFRPLAGHLFQSSVSGGLQGVCLLVAGGSFFFRLPVGGRRSARSLC